MAKISDSRDKTIVAAAKLFRQRGYHGVGLQDILEAAGSPRGSLYFHFPGGKEEIGAAALAFYAAAVRGLIASAAERSETAQAFLVAIFRGIAAEVDRADFSEGCAVAAVVLETVGQSKVLAEAAVSAFRSWEIEIERGLSRFGVGDANAKLIATVALSQLEGALLLARTYRSLEPLRRAETMVGLLAGAASP